MKSLICNYSSHLRLHFVKCFPTVEVSHKRWHVPRRQLHKNTVEPQTWNVLFFGTDEFSLKSLQCLYNEYRLRNTISRLEIVTSYKRTQNPILRYAKQKEITVHKWPLQDLNVSQFHIGIVVSFGYLIPVNIINSIPLGMLNVHASLLPRWRGAAPIIYSLMNGDTETGVTIMKIAPKRFDVGEILASEKTVINPDESLPDLYNKLAEMGANLLLRTLKQLPGVLSEARPQGEEGVTYAPKVSPKNCVVKWSEMTAKDIHNLNRAFSGLYPLTTKFNGITLKLSDLRISQKPEFLLKNANVEELKPGVILYSRKSNSLIVKCKDESWISVEKVTFKGKRMTAKDFSNGFLSKSKNRFSCMFQDQ